MANTASSSFSSVASWGIGQGSGAVSSSKWTGVVTDLTVHKEFSLGPLNNEVGSVIGQTKYDEHWTANATIICKNTAKLPVYSDQITVKTTGETITGYVTGCDITENNQSYFKISVSIEKYADCEKIAVSANS